MKKSIKIPLATILALLVAFVGMYFGFYSVQMKSASTFDISSLSGKVTTEDFNQYFNGYEGCFVLYDMNKDEYFIHNQEKSQERMEPGSTFNIINSLIGLETGILKDEKGILEWDGKEIGKEKLKEYLDKMHYGDCNIAGDIKKSSFASTLKISPLEQVEILKKMYTYELPCLPDNIDMVKKAMVLTKENNGVLSGISHTEKNGKTWFIGYLEKSSNAYIFATYLEEENNTNDQIAREITEKILSDKDNIRRKEKRGKVVYEVPNMSKVSVKKDIVYKVDDNMELKLDVYYSLEDKVEDKPNTVILIHGSTPDKKFKDKKYFTSWGRLVAASGNNAVTFNWRSGRVPTDISDLIKYVREHAHELDVESDRISIIAFSAGTQDGVREAVSVDTGFIDSIVAYYGKMPISILDNTSGGKLPPMFVAKAARDSYFASDCNDEFLEKASDLECNVTEVVHSEGVHGFDVFTDNEESYDIIKKSLDFIEMNRNSN